MSYYKYKPRDPQVQVNWTEAASNLTKVLSDEVDFRNQQKAAIDEATRKYQEQLNNQPQGESTSIREWGLKFGEQAQKQLLMQDTLLKNGMLNPNDYTIMRQNLVDGTDQAFSLMEHYQEVYANKMERMKSQDIKNKSQQFESFLMENAEGYANFNNSQLAINPETGKVTAAMMRDNGNGGRELTQDPNQFVAISSLQGQILGEYDEFDVGAVTSKFVAETGAWTQIEKIVGTREKAGMLIKSLNPFTKELDSKTAKVLGISENDRDSINYYLQAENAAINGVFGDQYNISSILTENVVVADNGKNYTFSFGKRPVKGEGEGEDTDSNIIYVERQGEKYVFDFSEKQEEAVKAYMRNDIRNKTNITKEVASVNDWKDNTASEKIKKNEEDIFASQVDALTNINYIWNGNKEQLNTAINVLSSRPGTNIKNITRTADGIIINYNDETPRFVIENMSEMTQAEFLKSHGNRFLGTSEQISNYDDVLKELNLGDGTDAGSTIADNIQDVIEVETINQAYDRMRQEENEGNQYTPVKFLVPNERSKNINEMIRQQPGLLNYSMNTNGQILDEKNQIVETVDLAELDADGAERLFKRILAMSKRTQSRDDIFDLADENRKIITPATETTPATEPSLELNPEGE